MKSNPKAALRAADNALDQLRELEESWFSRTVLKIT